MSNYGVYFVWFFFLLLCTVNHVLKTSGLPLLCTVELNFYFIFFFLFEYCNHLDVFGCILILKC